MKQTLRELALEDEVVQPSRTAVKMRELVEANVKVVEGCNEVPIPLKSVVTERLPKNYAAALGRTESLRRNALKNVETRRMLTATFQEMITEGWILLLEENSEDKSLCWYLSFFVTRQDRPRVVFDGATVFEGMFLN